MAANASRARRLETLVSSFADFRQQLSARYAAFDVDSGNRSRFYGRIDSVTRDKVNFASIEANNHTITRNESLVDTSPADYYKLSFVRSGHGLLVQGPNETVLKPGDIVLYDAARPYAIALEDGISTFVVVVPHGEISVPRDAVAELTAVSIATNSGVGAVAGAYLNGLARDLEVLDKPIGGRLARQTVDMVITLLAEQLDTHPEALGSNAALMRRLRNYIDTHLTDSSIGPREIAAANYISSRWLHTLFEREGTTVGRWMRQRRLAESRRMLRDPAYAHLTIAEIAGWWGFSDGSHFSRSFKEEYGELPRDFRLRSRN